MIVDLRTSFLREGRANYESMKFEERILRETGKSLIQFLRVITKDHRNNHLSNAVIGHMRATFCSA